MSYLCQATRGIDWHIYGSLLQEENGYTIVENGNVKVKHFKELKKKTLLEQKHPKYLIEANILKDKK